MKEVTSLPAPDSVEKVQKFLIIVNWLRKFTVELASPLYDLLKKG